MKKRLNPEMIDEENPEWSDDDFKKALPAGKALPEILGHTVASEFLKHKNGKSQRKRSSKKELVTINLHSDVLNFFRDQGPDWEILIDTALKEWVEEHGA